MARSPNEKVLEAYDLFKAGYKLMDIAKQLELPEGTVRRWKSIYKWDSERSDSLKKSKTNVRKEKDSKKKKKPHGGIGNKNATGPPGNKHAEKHGFYSKYIPQETLDIMNQVKSMNPIDILWDNIQIQYAAIVRAQQLMFVKDQQDMTMTKVEEKHFDGELSGEKWEVQYAWDKHATFLSAQSRAMQTLGNMIAKYEELIKSDLATAEQKARLELLKLKILSEGSVSEEYEDDGFIAALGGKAAEVWKEESEDVKDEA